MELGVHLPLLKLDDEPLSFARLAAAVDAARECGFAAVSANDHFLFSAPWLDGPVALAAVIERSGEMALATTITLAALRGPVPVAKALAAIDVLSDGRCEAGLGPGSSRRDYDAVGVAFEERWARFDEAAAIVRALVRDEPLPDSPRFYSLPDERLEPGPRRRLPIWIGSWGSAAGLRRVVRYGDGWLASAYNTTPDGFASAREQLGRELAARDRPPDRYPNALVTMWTWVTDDRRDAERAFHAVLAPLLRRDPSELAGRLCVGPPEHCAEVLSRYADAGCQRVHLWPLGDERRQVERLATTVAPLIRGDA